MPRLPQPGSDDGVWGNVLNDFLSAAHNADGTLKPASVAGVAPVQSVNGQTGAVSLTAAAVGADASGAAASAQTNAQSYADTQVATSPAFIMYSSGYPARSTATASATRVVIWIGPVAPSVGGNGAVDGVDVWWRTP